MSPEDIRAMIRDELSALRASLEAKISDERLAHRFGQDGMAPGTVTPGYMAATSQATRATWDARRTGALQITITLGKLMFKGVSKTITDWPADGVVDLTDNATTWGWIETSLVDGACTWETGAADPGDGDDDTEPIRIFKAVAASGRITELLICRDIRLPGNA
jgi:hypothetical protein